MTAKAKRSKQWSYSVGERGRNRVRAFEKDGRFFVEYYDHLPGQTTPVRKRLGVYGADRELAKAKAEELAAAFRREERRYVGRLTLGMLFDIYEREQSVQKGRGTRQHDAVALGLFRRAFGADRDVQTLSRRDLERFVRLRASGELAPPTCSARRGRGATVASRKLRPVRMRTVQYDLKVLMAVLNWATTTRDERGVVLLERNPLKGLPIPSESSPLRATFTDAQFTALCEQAASVSPLFRLTVLVAYYTGHRIGAIRHLRWSDIDFDQGRITWQAKHDKRRRGHVTPLPAALATVLLAERRQRLTIGDGWLFPNPKDPAEPLPMHVAGDWMTRGLKLIGIEQGERYGYHAIRRQFATSMKHLPLADLCALGGWKDSQTVVRCYMQADEQTMREALESRRPLTAVAG